MARKKATEDVDTLAADLDEDGWDDADPDVGTDVDVEDDIEDIEDLDDIDDLEDVVDDDDDVLVDDDDEDEVDLDEGGEAEDEALDELEAEELELLADDEEDEVLVVDEAAELRAIRREELALKNRGAEEARSDEFVCASCFLVKRSSQLANPRKKICKDCAA